MARTSRSRRGPLEKEIQKPLVAILRLSGLFVIGVPNSTDLHLPKQARIAYIGRQIALGLQKGAPDLLIFTPPPCGVYTGLALELKTRTGAARKSQLACRDRLLACGWAWRMPRSVDEAVAELQAFGYVIKRTPLG